MIKHYKIVLLLLVSLVLFIWIFIFSNLKLFLKTNNYLIGKQEQVLGETSINQFSCISDDQARAFLLKSSKNVTFFLDTKQINMPLKDILYCINIPKCQINPTDEVQCKKYEFSLDRTCIQHHFDAKPLYSYSNNVNSKYIALENSFFKIDYDSFYSRLETNIKNNLNYCIIQYSEYTYPITLNIPLNQKGDGSVKNIKNVNIPKIEIKAEDKSKVLKQEQSIKNLFNKYNMPLSANAKDFAYVAYYYQIDYRLLPAIAFVESTGGKNTFRTNNPFGWGNWGYLSFKHAIYDVAKGIKEGYYNNNLKTPRQIAPKYNPDTPDAWSGKIIKLMGKM